MVAKEKLKKIKKASEIKIKIENNAIYHNNKSIFDNINMKLDILLPIHIAAYRHIRIDDCTEKTTVKDLFQKIKTIFNNEGWVYYPMKLRMDWGTELTDMEKTLDNYSMINIGHYSLRLSFR